MFRDVSLTSVLVLLAVAGPAAARDYTGSDSLQTFTRALVAQCGAINGGLSYPALAGSNPQFNYIGGGSDQGGLDLRNGEQDIAPQARPMNSAEACQNFIAGNPSSGSGNLGNDESPIIINPPGSGAEGLMVAIDGLSIVVGAPTGARCDPTPSDGFAAPLANTPSKTFSVTNFLTNVPDGAASIGVFNDIPLPAPGGVLEGGPPGTLVYRFTDFKDVLRILFAGADKSRPLAFGPGGGGGATQSAANRLSRCSSDIRRSLVSQWDNIVEGNPATCTGQTCGTIRRLFRRGDSSDSTSSFLSLLGLASAANQPFCNGTENDDQDPIRRACLPDDDVCGKADLGLVQAVELHDLDGVSTANERAAQFPTVPCRTGVFVLRDAPLLPDGSTVRTCPDGSPQIFTKCLTPQSGPATAVGVGAGVNCLNSQLNTSFLTPGGNDGRAWNRELRTASGALRTQRSTGPGVPVFVTNAVHRMRSRIGGAQCTFDDATIGVGCIVGSTACTLGFAGRGATEGANASLAVAAPVGNIAPTAANIQTLAYPLSTPLFFNSITGFANIRSEIPALANQAEQQQLVRCLEREPAAHAAAIAASGLLPLPAIDPNVLVPGHVVEFRRGPVPGTELSTNPGLLCEDVNEVVFCGAPTDVPHCVSL
jgi:hypothetical protein